MDVSERSVLLGNLRTSEQYRKNWEKIFGKKIKKKKVKGVKKIKIKK